MITLYVRFLVFVLRFGIIMGGIVGYANLKDYYKGKAHQSLKRGLISNKAINDSFFGKRNYTKYKDYREVMRDYNYKN